ncbi:hypothetical protein BVC80_9095g15 [Macleaya cordata]|uniref:Protein SMG9 n=1 Tax=Macleaya cordata TaxID=56857 RepID=A0A200PXA0_MACCD|nr:hypothetical protein BVC80_9095g15 [Macleaya cordata]
MAAPPPPPPSSSSSSATAMNNNSSSNQSPSVTSTSSSSSSNAPKILLAKPTSTSTESSSSTLRSRLPPVGSLNLVSDSWDLHTDRVLPFLTENTDFTVIGIIGPPVVGKSTILNEIYGFDGNSSGMLPPFATQSEETRAMARHSTVGIELRVSSERLILLDTQPIFSPSVLAEMMRPDGSSTISLTNGEVLSADLAHEIMGIQLGVFLASICHVLLVVSEGVHDINMWHLMLTVDLLKHGIPDPSSLTPSYSQGANAGSEKENKDSLQEAGVEYLAAPVFVHTKLRDPDLSPDKAAWMRNKLSQYFSSSSFKETKSGNTTEEQNYSVGSPGINIDDLSSTGLNLFLLPHRNQDDSQRAQYESCVTLLGKLRDQMLSMKCRPFAKTVSEREWLKNTARIWETVKSSPVIVEYCKTLQSSGMFRK